MPDPREIELKLDIDPLEVADLGTRVLPNLGVGGGRRRLVSVYYDTPGLALRDAGMTLRLRETCGQRIQTVKLATRSSAGLFDRSEWETPVTGREPDRDAVDDTPAGRVLAKARAAPEPVFESVVDRTVWRIDSERSSIEVALDVGRVSTGGRAEALAELELELKRGSASDLFDLLRELNEVASLRIGAHTKSERGYRLLTGDEQRPVKAVRVSLDRDTSTAAAFQAVVLGCLRQFRLNEPLLVEQRLPEALHQARVALRRLRSALSLFKSVIADPEIDRLKGRLRSVSKELGEARNLDVYLARSVRPRIQGDAASGGEHFASEVETARGAAYDRLVDTLRSAAFRRLMVDLLVWAQAGPWVASEDALRRAVRERPVRFFAARTLHARRGKVLKKGRGLRKLDPPTRHRLRIEAKKLRYAAEFFATLCRDRKERGRHKAFIAVMEDFQQHLGDLNDIQTAHELAHELATHQPPDDPQAPDAAFAAGVVTAMEDARVEDLLGKADKALRSLKRVKPFWTRWAR